MKVARQTKLALAALTGLGMGVVDAHPHADATELAALRRENSSLKQSVVVANKRAEDSAAKLKDIQLQLEAMGAGVLDGGENRLVNAVAEVRVLSNKLKELETAALALTDSTQKYLQTAIAADPESRTELEARLRELEAVMGLREKPAKERRTGNLQQADVVSVDQDSGVVVANVGEKESVVIGMAFEVFRNDAKVGDALVAMTRADVSALLITDLENEENPVRSGDRVSLKRN